jgi:anti-anti-sigma factor
MQIFNSKNENTLVLEVRGRLDTLTAAKLEAECDTWINKGEKDLLLDLGGVDYISSAGLRAILLIGRKLNAISGNLRFCSLGGMVKEVFSISGFNSMFPVYASLTEALQQN